MRRTHRMPSTGDRATEESLLQPPSPPVRSLESGSRSLDAGPYPVGRRSQSHLVRGSGEAGVGLVGGERRQPPPARQKPSHGGHHSQAKSRRELQSGFGSRAWGFVRAGPFRDELIAVPSFHLEQIGPMGVEDLGGAGGPSCGSRGGGARSCRSAGTPGFGKQPPRPAFTRKDGPWAMFRSGNGNRPAPDLNASRTHRPTFNASADDAGISRGNESTSRSRSSGSSCCAR